MVSRVGAGDGIVVTGLGAITPIGSDVASTWSAMLAGRSGISEIREDWAGKLPVRIAGMLKTMPALYFDHVRAGRMGRREQIAVIAAREAWEDAGAPGADPERIAVVIGTAVGGAQTLLAQDDVLEVSGARHASPHGAPKMTASGPAAYVSMDLGARGGAPASPCASGAEAIALGMDLLLTGNADIVVAGGAEACITPIAIAGFGQAGVLSRRNEAPERASRPFDLHRDGFVLGEGSAMMVLERAGSAAARGLRPYARLAGAGVTSDAHDMTARIVAGQVEAIRLALRASGISGSDIQHVHAHATSAQTGDLTEAMAIEAAIGRHPAVTATKSITGHLFGASGALGALAGVLATRNQVIPGTQNIETTDPRISLDIVKGQPRAAKISAALTNSFGFGGCNVSLVFTSK